MGDEKKPWQTGQCVDCGAPIKETSRRCRSCAMKNIAASRKVDQGQHCGNCGKGKRLLNLAGLCKDCTPEAERIQANIERVVQKAKEREAAGESSPVGMYQGRTVVRRGRGQSIGCHKI